MEPTDNIESEVKNILEEIDRVSMPFFHDGMTSKFQKIGTGIKLQIYLNVIKCSPK
jgi:hypothetical protein